MKKTYIRYIPGEIPNSVNGGFFHTFKFWLPTSKWYYPYLLFSTVFFYDDGLPDEVKDNCFVFGDSGGFQEGKKEFAHILRPEIIIEAQEENCDAGFILDKPPWKIGKDYSSDWFERCARITKEDGDRMYELQEREDFQLYGIIQGRGPDEWDYWYETLTKDHDYDHWAMSPAGRAAKLDAVIDFGFWAKEKGIKDFHVLGVGFQEFAPTFGYLVNKLDLGSCTCDTSVSKFSMGAVATTFQRRLARPNPVEQDFQYPFCLCPVCQDFDEQYVDNAQYIAKYVHIHTFYHRASIYEIVNSICDCAEDLVTLEPKCEPYINKIDEMLDGGGKERKIQGKIEVF